jgi:hypothetical protein
MMDLELVRELVSRWKCISKNNAKNASYKLKVSHYGLLTIEKTHLVFKSP